MKLTQFIKKNNQGIIILILVGLVTTIILGLCEFMLQYFYPNQFSLKPKLSTQEIFNTMKLFIGIILIIAYDFFTINRPQLSLRQRFYFFKRLFMLNGSISNIKRDFFLYEFNMSIVHQNAFKEINLKALNRFESFRFVTQTFISWLVIPTVALLLFIRYINNNLHYSLYWGIAFVFLLYIFRKYYIGRVLFPAKMIEEMISIKDLFNSNNWREDLNKIDEVFFTDFYLTKSKSTNEKKEGHFHKVMDYLSDPENYDKTEKCSFIKNGTKYDVNPYHKGAYCATLAILITALQNSGYFDFNSNKYNAMNVKLWLELKFNFYAKTETGFSGQKFAEVYTVKAKKGYLDILTRKLNEINLD